jgi:hypothetical protein
MNGAPDAEPEAASYIRLPWPIVGAGLFLVLVALLGLGLFANRNLRPQTAAAPTAVLVEPTPTSLPVVAATLVVTPTSEPRVIATGTVAAATSTPAAATAAPTATPRPTVIPELAAEVGNAYKQYWQVRSEALFDLDSSHLSEVMAGEHLASIENLIEDLRTEGHAIQTDVNHKYAIIQASLNDAEVADTYTDSSVYVDAQSHAVLSQPANDVLQEEYRLSRINGGWRVVSLVRAS